MKRDLYTWKETYIHEKRRIKRPMLHTFHTCCTYFVLVAHISYLLHTFYTCCTHFIHVTASPKETYTHQNSTHIHEKRPIYMRRDLYTGKETYKSDPCCTQITASPEGTYIYIWHETHMHKKRPIHMERDNTHEKRRTKVTHVAHISYIKRNLYTWKETYTHEKRRIKATHVARISYIWRDLYTWKETNTHENIHKKRTMLDTYHPLHTYDTYHRIT